MESASSRVVRILPPIHGKTKMRFCSTKDLESTQAYDAKYAEKLYDLWTAAKDAFSGEDPWMAQTYPVEESEIIDWDQWMEMAHRAKSPKFYINWMKDCNLLDVCEMTGVPVYFPLA